MVELTYPAVETEEERAKVVSETLVASTIFNPKNLTSDFPNVGVRSVASLSLSLSPCSRTRDRWSVTKNVENGRGKTRTAIRAGGGEEVHRVNRRE